ncbi:hypothetical protein M5G22_14480 [Pseudomonas sp. TNT2022 ID233]|uniref:hypothetical protein n=1 Tax=Pseudomonas aphyarum TaxID=2942629 RepID=UPI00235F3F3B|nr:hypothetical protein [Pseudomonas aphyarum]MDD1138757.1 hypothetical protein [Pseudomonas aphyarum]
MANTQLSLIPQNFPVTVNMLVVLKGAEKMEAEMKGLRGKVAAFKKSMEDSGLEPLDVAGFISEGGLLKPFQDGVKKAIEAQDALAKKVRANKGLKVPKVVHGETSANLEKFNKALDKVSLKIGQALLPAVNSIVTAMTPVITSIGQFLANNPYLVEGLAAAAVAFTVVTVGAMGLVAVLGILASPIGLVAAAIAGAVALIVIGARLITNNWSSISGVFSKMWTSTREAFDSGVTAVKEGLASMGASIGKTWDETRELFSAGVDTVTKFFDETVASATAGIEALCAKFSFSPREVMDKALATAGTVISDFFDSTIARAKAGIEALSAKFSFSPREVMDKALKTASTVVSDFWDSAVANATTGIEKLKATFSFSPREVLSQAMATASGVVGDFYNGVVASAAAGVESLKARFSWSPMQTINEAWQPVTDVFSALRDVVGASMASLQDSLRRVFDVLPVESATAAWGGVTGYFSGLWASLTTDAQSVKGVFGDLFGQSPLDSIKQKWEPVIVWFSDMWTRLQSIFGQVKELLGGHFSGFFETVTGSAATPAGAAGLNSPLPQSSSALIQQSAANSRTQLEGGLTVRFENAPAGLRTDQPQTNQPGLALSSRIGYRSLSMGGSNELA